MPGDPPAMPPLIIGPRTYAFCARVCAATHTHTRTRTAHMPPPPAPIYVDGLVSAHIYRLYDHVRTCARTTHFDEQPVAAAAAAASAPGDSFVCLVTDRTQTPANGYANECATYAQLTRVLATAPRAHSGRSIDQARSRRKPRLTGPQTLLLD